MKDRSNLFLESVSDPSVQNNFKKLLSAMRDLFDAETFTRRSVTISEGENKFKLAAKNIENIGLGMLSLKEVSAFLTPPSIVYHSAPFVLPIYDFVHTAARGLFGTVVLPHSYKENSPILPYIVFYPFAIRVGEIIRWTLSYEILNSDEGKGSYAVKNVDYTVKSTDVANKSIVLDFSQIDDDNLRIGSIINFGIKRDTTVANNYLASCLSPAMGFYIETDSLGSDQRREKTFFKRKA